MTTTAIVTNIVSLLSGLTGMTKAYERPPESIHEFPAAVAYVGRGELEVPSDGWAKNMHTIIVEIYHQRWDFVNSIRESEEWVDKVLQALHDNQNLGNSVQHIVWPVRYKIGPIVYDGDNIFYGPRFEITVKETRTL